MSSRPNSLLSLPFFPALSRPALCRLALLPSAVLLLAACDGEPVDYSSSDHYEISWLWGSGSADFGTPGVYGSLGVADLDNRPGAREGAVSWVAADGAFWLFGGLGYDANGDLGRLNDLWTLEAGGWAWVAGSPTVNAATVPALVPAVPDDPGTAGVDESAPEIPATPGGRSQALGWADPDGQLWLFGGNGYDAAPALGRLSDLWQFDPDAGLWTRVDGSVARDQPGVYGTRGTADPANAPGGRYGAAGWVDDAGQLWLFGGNGYAAAGAAGWLNDLWTFDGAAWTWLRGADTTNAPTVYAEAAAVDDDPDTVGTDESVPAITADMVTPGGRQGTASWHLPDPHPLTGDDTETGWLFGGIGNDKDGNRAAFAETWRFDGTDWAFAHGISNLGFTKGSYGGRGVFTLTALPPSRSRAMAWTSGTTLWLFGGAVETSDDGKVVYPNDLWRFDFAGWTWVGGDNTLLNSAGQYPPAPGGKGLPAGREGSIGWVDFTGGLWLFGGSVDSAADARDDLWFFSTP